MVTAPQTGVETGRALHASTKLRAFGIICRGKGNNKLMVCASDLISRSPIRYSYAEFMDAVAGGRGVLVGNAIFI